MSRHEDVRRIVDGGVIAVMRGVEAEDALPVAQALSAGGVRAMEFTMDSADAVENIERAADTFAEEPTLIGAGTVLDAESARAAILAGAEFVVCPTVSEEVIEMCNRYGVPVAPGVATPTEALTAYEAGADLIKLFPAGQLGPGYLKSILGPLGQLPIVPTGGVSHDNAAEFVEAGAVAVGAGGALVDSEAIEEGDYAELEELARRLVEIVRDAREE